MSDEVKRARIRVPRSMIFSGVVNGIMPFLYMVTVLFTIGDVTGLPIPRCNHRDLFSSHWVPDSDKSVRLHVALHRFRVLLQRIGVGLTSRVGFLEGRWTPILARVCESAPETDEPFRSCRYFSHEHNSGRGSQEGF
jgi:hypothetical protein